MGIFVQIVRIITQQIVPILCWVKVFFHKFYLLKAGRKKMWTFFRPEKLSVNKYLAER